MNRHWKVASLVAGLAGLALAGCESREERAERLVRRLEQNAAARSEPRGGARADAGAALGVGGSGTEPVPPVQQPAQ